MQKTTLSAHPKDEPSRICRVEESSWNTCECGNKTRYRTGKFCHRCSKRRQLEGVNPRISSLNKPWNRCSGEVKPGCNRLAMYRNGSACKPCHQKKYWLKNKEANRLKCELYYLKNRDKERARRRKYYQEHREEEILNAQLYRLNKERKAREAKGNLPTSQPAPAQSD